MYGSSSSVIVASPPSPITVARRSVVANTGDHSTASLTSPASLTHSASTPSGTTSCGMPGATLTTPRPASSSSTNDHGGVQPSMSKTRPRAPRRAGSAKTAPKPFGSMVAHVGDLDGAGQTEGGQVGPGDGDAHRIEVDAGRGQAGAGEGDQVAADAAAEVDHARGLGRGEPGGSVLGDPQPGGLLEGVRGEEHEGCQIPELRHRARPQLHLRQCRRGAFGVRLCLPHGGRGADRVAGCVGVRPHRDLEEVTAGIGQQPFEREDVHSRILSGGPIPAGTR